MIIWCVIVNFSLPCTTICTISSPSFYAGGRCVFSFCCIMAYGTTWFCTYCIVSWTSMILAMISFLCASTIWTTSSPLSWTLSMTNSASSSVRVMTRYFVMYFLFLCTFFPSLDSLLFVRDAPHLLYPGPSLPQPVKYHPFRSMAGYLSLSLFLSSLVFLVPTFIRMILCCNLSSIICLDVCSH
jgi:hypothetical protein